MQHSQSCRVYKIQMETNLQAIHINKSSIDATVDRCKAGDQEAYRRLYEQFIKAMYNTSFRILNSHPNAEDAVQEAFIDAFRQLNRFDGRSTFGHWLKRIVINKSIDILRRKDHFLQDVDEIQDPEYAADRTSEYDGPFDLDTILACICELPSGYRTVLSLYLLEGYDHQEIAQILDVAESTTRTQYMRAKKKLQENLNARINE